MEWSRALDQVTARMLPAVALRQLLDDRRRRAARPPRPAPEHQPSRPVRREAVAASALGTTRGGLR